MQNEIDFLEEINSKYSKLEKELDIKLKRILQDEQKLNSVPSLQNTAEEKLNSNRKIYNSLEEVKIRNKDLIKSLEVSKARLRSRRTYSPIESILGKAINNYQIEYSLTPNNMEV